MRKYILVIVAMISLAGHNYAQRNSDAHIIGHVISEGKHLPFASISIKGTNMGTLADESGHFQILHVPPGEYTVIASSVGFEPGEIHVTVFAQKTREIKFDLNKDVLNINQVVVSSDRSEQKRTEAPVIVSTLSSKLFSVTQSNSLGEGLVFTPGIRLENNCQNCGFSQVRLNGMEGPYSQILINSRPIFSGLAGVYGLELIPANMIERVEVVRGGGSAMFGSNAIAGTINVILKDPLINSFEIGTNYSMIGVGTEAEKAAGDYALNFNTSMVSSTSRTGMVLYGTIRERSPFDANNDSFTELTPLENLTVGSRFFHRFGSRAKLSLDLFNIREDRNGGNKQDYPLHERDIAEAVEHDIKTASLTYEQFFREYDLLSVFASGQYLQRDSYYGANQSLSDYGYSTDLTYNLGVQYKTWFGRSTLVSGLEHTAGRLKDTKLGYPDLDNALVEEGSLSNIPHVGNTLVANQKLLTTGAFAQYELRINTTRLNVGGRLDQYQILSMAGDADNKNGLVFSPRISLMQEVLTSLQARVSYAQGYRAPQIFDEDLHIETSGARQVIHVNDPNLTQESSHSITASLDFNELIGHTYFGFLAEAFSTWLVNPFVNDIGAPDENGRVIYTRTNALSGAKVQGINFEMKMSFNGPLTLNSGLTLQRSLYDQPQEFNERRFFKTPDRYGYLALDYQLTELSGFNINGTWTGPMLIPYFGPLIENPDAGELRRTNDFLDMGIRAYVNQKADGLNLEWFAGVKNIFNAYQNDFDIGIDRDPAYMYGPLAPRSIYIGLKISNRAVDLSTPENVRPRRGIGRGVQSGQGRGSGRGWRFRNN